MEWVETTGRSLDEAKEQALESLGIVADEAEFEVLEEPKTGLFGRTRGTARVRARVKPATVRPKQDRRGRRRTDSKSSDERPAGGEGANVTTTAGEPSGRGEDSDAQRAPRRSGGQRRRSPAAGGPSASPTTSPTDTTDQGDTMSNDQANDNDRGPRRREPAGPVDAAQVEHVREAAVVFTDGLVEAFGLQGESAASVEGNEIEVRVDPPPSAEHDGLGPSGLGLLIGPGGRTLLAIQDLARVAAQRRLGDHDTRLRIDVAGYREKRRVALERFARSVADTVKESGTARSLDPMPSADRKVIHDALTSIDGVSSMSEGEDPNRRIVVVPA